MHSNSLLRRGRGLLSAAVAATLLSGGCGQSASPSPAPGASSSPAAPSASPPSASPSPASPSPSAGEAGRVDLGEPAFSNPTSITNALFPIGELTQVIRLGEEGGEPARVELTLLPETRVIEWNGQQVETLVSQFIGYTGGRVVEVAKDYYAQADDGSVWYFGEDVDNYEDGAIADHGGSWLAGRDGPPGMIMPAGPQVGNVFHPENIPGLVFEVVTVQSTTETLDGPRGQIDGAIRVEEVLMEGDIEHKVYAANYGEFRTEAQDELVIVALGVPTDALTGEVPGPLTALGDEARAVFDAAPSLNWTALAASVDKMTASWEGLGTEGMPKLLADQMAGALERLATAVESREAADVRQGAIDVAGAGLDLELQYRQPSSVDLDRLDLWARQIVADAAADEAAGVLGDVATLETIWNRVRRAVATADAEAIGGQLADLRTAADGEDLEAAGEGAAALIAAVAGIGG